MPEGIWFKLIQEVQTAVTLTVQMGVNHSRDINEVL